MSARSELTPQMLAYDEKFADDGAVRWLPHLIYFHPPNHRSPVVNTDAAGFRFSRRGNHSYSVADCADLESVRLIAGSSTVFGIGASSDAWTLASRMSVHDQRDQPWVNFGGRSFNSTQELLLVTLYRHLLPRVAEIVLFSGFNNLGLARMPESAVEEHGAFFMYHRYRAALDEADRRSPRFSVGRALRGLGGRSPRRDRPADRRVPDLPEQLSRAVELTTRHLDGWRILAEDWGAKLTYVLQPLSGWVRARGTPEEERLFAELDATGGFSQAYGDILTPAVCQEYATLLADRTKELGVNLVNLSPILSDVLAPDQWVFVDRIHFTDDGHDFVARTLLESI
ncbi:Inducer of phenazine A [Solwaraspora sp. WMMD406]|uniref:Inducer of phenazine A n=1 Tax=Solwaraspora sp. WMMD406 TaxID=3016095 RepID=UPI002415FA97|nr:Inducer of phenazine A [Solwaraspora sp. WMMD406]MDG4763214.1 Inducer of phenazine A [Solwaraspora sp. WMMD406]